MTFVALGFTLSLGYDVYYDAVVVFATCRTGSVILAQSAAFTFDETASRKSMMAPTFA